MDRTLILELSSDEEVGFDNSSSADNFDWITKLIEDDDPPNFNEGLIYPNNHNNGDNNNNSNGGNDDDDEDDVVVVGEVIVKKPKKVKSFVSRNYDFDDGDGDDDDCVVLDGDPDKGKDEDVKNDDSFDKICEKNDVDDDDDDDDLVIVGEKGQVACRDFPHARHSCAKYPFDSTPHENRCDLCHCYVCDSLAPCAQWGSGLSSTDHCHATDKNEYWKLERTKLKTPSLSHSPITKPSTGSLSNSPQFHQISREFPRHSTNSGISSTLCPIRVDRRYRSSIPIASNKFPPYMPSRELPRSCNNGNSQIPGNRGPSLLSRTRVASNPIFKRPGVTTTPVGSFRELPRRYIRIPHQQSTGQFDQNNSINSRVSSLNSDLNLGFSPLSTSSLSPSTLTNLHPSPHTPTSQYRANFHSSGLVSNSNNNNNPYTYEPMNQPQNFSGPTLPISTQQYSGNPAMTQNIPGPSPGNLSSISQQTRQTSVEPSHSSPVFSCTTSNAWNSVSPSFQQSTIENSLVQPSIEQNGPPSDKETAPQTLFDLDYWLQDDGPVLDLFDENNNQASVSEPVDTGMLYFDFDTSMKGLTHL